MKLLGDVTQYISADGILMAIGAEKADLGPRDEVDKGVAWLRPCHYCILHSYFANLLSSSVISACPAAVGLTSLSRTIAWTLVGLS